MYACTENDSESPSEGAVVEFRKPVQPAFNSRRQTSIAATEGWDFSSKFSCGYPLQNGQHTHANRAVMELRTDSRSP